MSFSELMVVAIVAFLVLSPQDLKNLFKFFHSLRQQFHSIKQQVFQQINDNINTTDIMQVKDELDKINYYITQIHDLGSVYEGEYNLQQVQEAYQKLVAKKQQSTLPSAHP